MEAIIYATLGLVAIPVIRQAIKSYRAKKAIAEERKAEEEAAAAAKATAKAALLDRLGITAEEAALLLA